MNASQFTTWESAVSWLLQQPDQQELVKSCYYDRPPLEAAVRFWQSEEWGALRSFLPSNRGRALDVGAGMGIASFALARDGWRTTALEPDGSNLVGVGAIRALALEASVDIEVVQSSGEHLPFSDGTFDVVHARQVLHHARDLPRLCGEAARVLGPGGCLVATREHVVSSAAQLDAFLDRHPLQRIYGGENAFELRQYVSALKSAGLRIERVLGPLESVINYAPFTEASLCEEIRNRARLVPGAGWLADAILATPWRAKALTLLSHFDRRPGRLYTFVCTKPSRSSR